MIVVVTNENYTIIQAVRQFGDSLPPERHPDRQEAMRFARWFGEERPATDIRPSDLEGYVETFGATAPNAPARADSLKSFLAYAHKHKILPERLVSHVRVRKAAGRAKLSSSGSQQIVEVRITSEGRANLASELDQLISQRPQIAEELRAARADGDVRENAPLDAARENQGKVEARIRELEAMLRQAVIVDNVETDDNSSAHVGCSIVLSNMATGAQLSYQLVNPAEARGGTGKLSVESPVGQAVVGRRAGDEVQVQAPSGIVRFRIDRIEV